MTDVKYPDIEVKLIGEDGNAFTILGKVVKELRNAGLTSEEVELYKSEAMAGDYNHLLATTMRWVVVD